MRTANTLFDAFSYATLALLVVVSIMDISVQPSRIIIWTASFLLLLFALSIKSMPPYLKFLFSLAVVMNVLGEVILAIFYHFIYYDKIVHFFVPIVVCLLIVHVTEKKIENKKLLAVFCICATVSLAVGWEILEYSFDKNFDTVMQGVYVNEESHFFGIYERRVILDKNDDTMTDLMFNVLGSGCFGAGYLLYNNKKIKRKRER